MNKMVATTLDSKIYLFDLKNLEKNNYLRCNKLIGEVNNTTVWGTKFLPQKRNIFISLGGNGSLNIYKYNDSDFLYDDLGNNKSENQNLTLLSNNIIL